MRRTERLFRLVNEMRTRAVRPLVFWDLPEGWMASGRCELRQDFRTFRSDRIAGLALTGETFGDDPETGVAPVMAQEECCAD